MYKAILSHERDNEPGEYHEVGTLHRHVVTGSREQIITAAREYREHTHTSVRVELFRPERFYAPKPLETFIV